MNNSSDKPSALRAFLTPSVLKRMENAGYTPGECNPISWLISEVERLKAKNENLNEKITSINTLEVNRWKDGERAAAIKIAKWLRRSCEHPNHDDRWCQICESLNDAADRIDDGVHLSWEE